jgi:hypothetical protein
MSTENTQNEEIVDITPAPIAAPAVHNSHHTPSTGASFYNKINDPIEAVRVMGAMIAGSGMFGCTKEEQGMVLAMQCLAEGKAPLELAKTYHIIEGKLTMRADAMLGRYLTTGGKVKWTERSDKRVAGTWICDGNSIEIAVTLEEMMKNGVATGKDGRTLKTNWQRFPRQMLTARCISEAVRLLCPQIVSGIYTPEEVSDFGNSNTPIQPEGRRISPNVIAPIQAEPQRVENAQGAVNARLDELLEKYEPRASEYLIGKKYLQPGQTYCDLDAMTAQRILANPYKIISILEGAVS